jgi:hypothetical protein
MHMLHSGIAKVCVVQVQHKRHIHLNSARQATAFGQSTALDK